MVLPHEQARIEPLLPQVYDQLRALAERYVRSHPHGSMRATGLVHEAWIKLQVSKTASSYTGREHYAAVASRAMRQILIDRARGRGRAKRGASPFRTTLTGLTSDAVDIDVVDLNRAMSALDEIDPRGARIVELRYFGGLTVEEVARWLDLSERTVQSSWRFSRAFLVERLTESTG